MNIRALLLAFAFAALAPQGVAFAQPARGAAPPAPPVAPAVTLSEMRGTATDLAITPRGDVYVLDPAGGLWLQALDNRSGSFTKMPGEYAGVRATLDGRVWGLDKDGTLRLGGTVWKVFAENIRDVTATPDGTIIALTSSGELRTLGKDGQVVELPREFADPQRVLSDQHGLPWLVYADGRLARFNGLRWSVVPPPPAGVASLGIDNEGNVMAVSRAGLAYQRNPQTAQWEAIFAGSTFQGVAVGPGGKPWFIGADRKVLASQVFSQAGAAQVRPASAFTRMLSWKKTTGRSNQLSIAEDGSVLRLDTDGGISRWNRKDNWVPLSGRFVKVAALRGGEAWVIDDQGRVFRSQANGWLGVRAVASDIAAGPSGVVWIVQTDGSLARWDAKVAQFDPLRDTSPPAVAVAVGKDGEPWIIAQGGGVKSVQKGAWVDYPGIVAASLGVGPEGTVYATTAEAQLYWLDKRELQWKPATGKARKVAVGPKGAPWMIDDRDETYVSTLFTSENETRETQARPTSNSSNTQTTTGPAQNPGPFAAPTPFPTPFGSPAGPAAGAFVNPGAGTSAFVTSATSGVSVTASLPPAPKRAPLVYTLLNGAFQDVAINPAGTVFAAGMDGGLYCFSNLDKKFVFATAGQARRVAISPAGVPWVVSATGEIARFEGGGWKSVPNHRSRDVSIGSAGVVVSVGTDARVYLFNPSQNLFDTITTFTSGPQLQATRAARDDASGTVWAVTPSNQLLKCDRSACETQSIGAQDVALGADNTVYVIDLLGGVQRYNASRKTFEPQNGQGTAIAVGPQGQPWLVTSGGRINAAGFFGLSNTLINSPNCAAPFLQQVQAPVPPPVAAGATITAAADTATLEPGGTLNLLANDRLNGVVPTTAQISVNLAAQDPAMLTQTDGVLKLSASAVRGSTLTGTYTICALTGSSATSVCASAAVTISVAKGILPGAPTIGTATAGNGSATVAFTAPAANGGSTITGYTATSSPGGLTATSTGSPITVTGLTNGTAYTFTVVATNSAGTGSASAASNSVTPAGAATVPGAPTIGTATAGNASATVAFTAPASNGGSAITSYSAKSTPGGLTATSAGSPITVTGLTNGTAYTFTVTATNAIGTSAASAASNSVTPAVPVTVPGAPTIGTAVSSNSSASVPFTAPASNGGSAITSYTVTSSPGGLTSASPGSPIIVTGLTNGTAYTFTVTATNAIGTGPASAASNSVTPVGAPGAPTAPPSPPAPPSPGPIAFPGDAQALVDFSPPANNGGSPITSYTVIASPGPATATGFPADPAPPVTITGLTNGVSYTFTVTATNALGTGPASVATAPVTPLQTPTAPTITTVTAINGTDFQVAFTPPVTGAPFSGFTVYASDTSGPPIPFTPVGGASSPIVITVLSTANPHLISVTATNTTAEGPPFSCNVGGALPACP